MSSTILPHQEIASRATAAGPGCLRHARLRPVPTGRVSAASRVAGWAPIAAAVTTWLVLLGPGGANPPAWSGEASPVRQDSGSVPSANWPVFRGNPQSQGVSATQLPERLDVLWTWSAEDGAFDAAAVILDGTVYIGDLDGTLYALELNTGQPRWQQKMEAGFIASPAVRDGRVYLGDYDGVIYCFGQKKE